jgi:hypothetical protein
MSETRVYIPCPYHFGSKGTEESNDYIFVFLDRRVERTMAMGTYIWQSSEMSIQLTCCLSMGNP